MALKYLKNMEVNIGNILIITEDFNIRDSIWDSNFPHHSFYNNILFEVADSLNLELFRPTEQFPTRYSDNQQDSNLVIDLIFLRADSPEHNNYTIHPDWRLTSNHAPLTVNISIFKENFQTRKQMLVKNSKEEEYFLNELIKAIKKINSNNIQSKEALELVIQSFTNYTDRLWHKHSKYVIITKHFKK